MVKICDNCNNEIEEDTNFCPHCGNKLSEDMGICPVCHSENPPDAKFCTNCGYNFYEDQKGNFKSVVDNIVEGVKGTIGEERTEEYKQSIDKIQKNINDKYQGFKSNVAVNALPVNLVETEGFYYLQVNIAGVDQEQISIESSENSISIKVESNNVLSNIENYDESSSILIKNEFKDTVNERIFNFDEAIKEEIETNYENGVLLITLPKKEISENFEEKISAYSKRADDVAGQTAYSLENKGGNLKTKLTETKISSEEKIKEMEENDKKSANEIIKSKMEENEGLLYYVNGREAELFVYDDYLEFDFTGNLVKKYLSRLGGRKKIYYYQINSIQKRDAGSAILGSLEFEVPGMSVSTERRISKSENVIHYSKKYQEEIDKIFEFVNNKVLELNNAKLAPTQVINEVSPIDQLKEAKELLDLGIITEEEFVAMKQNIINK